MALAVWLAGCGTSQGRAPNPNDEVGAGRALFATNCARCHGPDGGGGIGPRLSGGAVTRTFPSCEDQILWVNLGSTGWKRAQGPTYGTTANPVRGGMPSFGSQLDSNQIRQVVTFTRVEFGLEDPARASSECS
ncbi:MAG: c-type cytochrome [Acidimicrobiia bacterium]